MKHVTLLMLCAALAFNGCAPCEPKIEYVDRPVEVLVPMKTPPPLDVNCTYSGSDVEVLGDMIACIQNLRKALEVYK